MNRKELPEKIAETYKDKEFKSFIIFGEHGYGMSNYYLMKLKSIINNNLE